MREIKLLFEENEGFVLDLDKFEVIDGEGDEISVVTNYPHRVLYNVKNEEDLKFIRAKGYSCENTHEKGYTIIRKLICEIHIVKPCETLSMIAKQYKTDEKTLVEKNHLKSNKVFIGQNIIV